MYHCNSQTIKMKYINQSIAAIIIFSIVLFSCGNEEDYVPESSFVKIYNDEYFNSSYIPMDIVQAGENGYFILSAYDSWNTYILRVDEQGEFMWDYKLDENYVNPISGLYYIDSAFYFFCMDDLSLGTYLMKATDQSGSAIVERSYGSIIYPLASSRAEDGFLLESYNRESYSTRLTKLSTDFGETWHEEYGVEEDVEESIISHLTRIGSRLPFFTGQAGNRYFLNGYYNYSMSLLFVNAANGSQTGVINGFRDESAISSTQYLDGNSFAISRFDHGENFIIPKMDLNTTGTGISSDLEGNEHPEMTPNAFVFSKIIDVNGIDVTLFATSTKGGQILLYAYDAINGTLVGTHHLGRLNPYEAVNFVPTDDGGLAVLGNTFVNGRFSRITLIKLSEQQLIEFAN
jgi:hypothetical protein